MTTEWTFLNGTFRHSQGYEVRCIGRAGYQYTDAYGEYFADGELLMGNPDAVVIADQIFKIKDGGRFLEMPKRRAVIANRIKLALESQGYSVEIA